MSDTTTPLLTVSDLSVHKGGDAVLNRVSLTLHEHSFTTIIGPNGAGKTTLLKCIIGLNTTHSGGIHKRPQLRIGYVPQHLTLNRMVPLRVSRFLSLHRPRHHNPDDDTAAQLNIRDLMPKPLHHLSGGELQRVLLARALQQKPQLLILDEPVQNLDIARQLNFYRLLEDIYTQQQFAVLMVSHDLHAVMRASHNVICLFHHICCQGKPQELSQMPAFLDLYGADADAEVLTTYRHHHNHSHD